MKPYLIIFAIIITAATAKAQSAYKTNESIASQLKNGTVPGLVYQKAESVKTTAEPVNMESSGKHITSNSLQGVVYEKKTVGTKPQTDSSVPPKPAVTLVSDKPAEQFVPVEKVVPPKSAPSQSPGN